VPSFTTRTRVPGSPARVFACIVDLAQWPSFRGSGPVPGIAEATLEEGGSLRTGSRVRVRNTDGSVHHEMVTELVPGRRYAVRMEVAPPASRVLETILEEVDLRAVDGGTEMVRRFELRPRSSLTWPLAWLVCHAFLRRAVIAHNAALCAVLES
jgi:uncharacterized protein YndB with AHSA1/START domain